jgi:hypothetical protein
MRLATTVVVCVLSLCHATTAFSAGRGGRGGGARGGASPGGSHAGFGSRMPSSGGGFSSTPGSVSGRGSGSAMDHFSGASGHMSSRSNEARGFDSSRRTSPQFDRHESFSRPTTLPSARDGARSPRETYSNLSGDPTNPSRPPQQREMSGTESAFDRQRLNEQRQFDHRMERSEQLRQIAARNGNDRLLDTADRMQDQAQGQLDRRTQRIETQQGRIAAPPRSSSAPRNATATPGNATAAPRNVGAPRSGAQRANTPPAKPSWGERIRGLWPFGRSGSGS